MTNGSQELSIHSFKNESNEKDKIEVLEAEVSIISYNNDNHIDFG